MKKCLAVLIASIFAMQLTYAETEKSKHCPDVNKIKIIELKKWAYKFEAYNKDNKFFYSGEYVGDVRNGPAPPLHLLEDETNYDASSKKLSCVYIAFAKIENSRPTLVNVGDY